MFHITHEQNTVRKKFFCKKNDHVTYTKQSQNSACHHLYKILIYNFCDPNVIETCIFIVYNTKIHFFWEQIVNSHINEEK
jgi:hypothetical protein